MANQKRKYSAIKIQRCIKGFLVRRKIQNLKSRVRLEQSCCNKVKPLHTTHETAKIFLKKSVRKSLLISKILLKKLWQLLEEVVVCMEDN